MAQIKIRFWKDIPVSVMVKGEQDKANVQLPPIYMETVDAVATRSGETGSKEYVAGFRFEESEQGGDVKELAEQIAAELQRKYDKEWLKEKWRTAGED